VEDSADTAEARAETEIDARVTGAGLGMRDANEPSTIGLCAQGIFIQKSRKLGIKGAFN
jgi:hypothetical protein